MATWQVQQAKTRLSELIEDAKTKGPQIITKHGSETAVVLSIAEYRKLSHRKKLNLHEYLLTGPKFDDGPFDNLRDENDTGREIDL